MAVNSQAGELRDALENLERNPEGLSTAEREERVREIAKQANQTADEASREGKAKEAAALYRLCALAHQILAGLVPGDLRDLELAMAKFWEEHAELIDKYQDRSPAADEVPAPSSKSRTIHTPKPIPLAPGTSVKREKMGRPPGFVPDHGRGAQRFERPQRKRIEEIEDQAHDSGAFRKPKPEEK